MHEEKYLHNKAIFFNVPGFNTPTLYEDWGITVLFYSALHLIERELAKLRMHSPNHEGRKNEILKRFSEIYDEYQILYDYSIRSRYNGHKFDQKDIDIVLTCFNKIEKYFRSH